MSAAHHYRLPADRPPWGGTLARSIFAGVALGVLSGFLTLLVTILTLWVGEIVLRRLHTDIRIVYRQIAPTVAVIVAALAFFGNLLWERTHPAPLAAGQRT